MQVNIEDILASSGQHQKPSQEYGTKDVLSTGMASSIVEYATMYFYYTIRYCTIQPHIYIYTHTHILMLYLYCTIVYCTLLHYTKHYTIHYVTHYVAHYAKHHTIHYTLYTIKHVIIYGILSFILFFFHQSLRDPTLLGRCSLGAAQAEGMKLVGVRLSDNMLHSPGRRGNSRAARPRGFKF